MQCLLPKSGARPERQNTRQRMPTEKYERTNSHPGQANRIVLTTANGITRLYPPEVELLEPRTAWKQKSPQVGVGISPFCLRLRVLLSGQLGLLSLLELFFVEIGLVVRASHGWREIAEMWRLWRLWCERGGVGVFVEWRGWIFAVRPL